MLALLIRAFAYKSQTIASGAALSDAFDMSKYTMGTLNMPAAWTAASIGFQVSSTEGGTYQAVYDDDGNLIQIDSPTASNSYTLPATVANFHWVKLWSQDGSASGTNQAAARTITLDLKS